MTSHIAVRALVIISITGPTGSEVDAAKDPMDLQRSRVAWKEGRTFYERGDFAAAMARFAEGHRLSGKGGFLYNMAECARELDDRPQARSLYLRYLREHPKGKHRDLALRRCHDLGLRPCEVLPPASRSRVVASSPGLASTKAAPSIPVLGPADIPVLRGGDLPLPADDPQSPSPWYEHWGLWASIGAAVLAGSAIAIVLATRPGENDPEATYRFDFR